jgi:uncharacterized surface protein with fasciclin (FAS1) repeats
MKAAASSSVRRWRFAFAALLVVLLFSSRQADAQNSTTTGSNTTTTSNSTDPPLAVPTTLADVVAAADNLTLLEALLELTNLTEVVRTVELTVFAPTDAALQAVPSRFAEDIEFMPHLTAILLYHVIDGTVLSGELKDGDELVTLNGETLTIQSVEPNVVINDNNSTVISADNVATNGVAHIIDRVLLPTAATSSIADLVTANPSLSILTMAVVAADLATALADFDSVYTVFAPSDAAFEKLPAGILAELLLPENVDVLTDLLLFHGTLWQGQMGSCFLLGRRLGCADFVSHAHPLSFCYYQKQPSFGRRCAQL